MDNKYNNYSKEDGSSINKVSNNSFILENTESTICRVCKNENTYNDNYCNECGENLSEVKSTIYNEKKHIKMYKDSRLYENINIKKIFLASISAIILLLIMASIFKIFYTIDSQNIGYSINPIYIALGFNLGQININSMNMLGSTNISAQIGIIILLLMPIISLSISNLVFIKKENKCAKTTFINSVGVGFIYAIILSLLSIIVKIKSSPYDLIQYSLEFSASYNILSIFINAFILGFLTTFILGFKKSYECENIYLAILKKVINISLLGYIIVLLLLSLITISDSSYLYEFGVNSYIGKIDISIILSQLSAYMWAFANIIPATIGNYTISIFNLIGSDLFLETKLIFIIMITVSLLLLLLAGCNLKRKYSQNKNSILIFSLFYAIFMGVIALFSGIVIDGNMNLMSMDNYQESIVFGFNILEAIIRSFLYSYIVTTIGYKLYVFD